METKKPAVMAIQGGLVPSGSQTAKILFLEVWRSNDHREAISKNTAIDFVQLSAKHGDNAEAVFSAVLIGKLLLSHD